MKNLLIVITFLLQSFTFAAVSDWSIINQEGEHWLQYKSFKTLRAKITKRTGKSKVIETKDIGKNYELVIYFTGAAGTFEIVNIYYAIIFDKKTKQFIGDYPWKYVAQESKKKYSNPVWDIAKDGKSIHIKDKQTDLDKKIKLHSN